VNLNDNAFLDRSGFSPFAEVVKGMDIIEKLYRFERLADARKLYTHTHTYRRGFCQHLTNEPLPTNPKPTPREPLPSESLVVHLPFFCPFGSGYGEGAPSGRGPNQAAIQGKGNSYLAEAFPLLSYVKSAKLL
jgi:hypothetical protein